MELTQTSMGSFVIQNIASDYKGTIELTTAVSLRWFLSSNFSFFHNCYFAAEIIYNYNKNTSGFLLKVGGENYYSVMIPFSFVDLSQ